MRDILIVDQFENMIINVFGMHFDFIILHVSTITEVPLLGSQIGPCLKCMVILRNNTHHDMVMILDQNLLIHQSLMRMLPNQTSLLGMICGIVMDRFPTSSSLNSLLLLVLNCQVQVQLIILGRQLVNSTWNWPVFLVVPTITWLLLYMKTFPTSCVHPQRFKTMLLVGELVSTNCAWLDTHSTMQTLSGSASITCHLALHITSFDNKLFLSYQLPSHLLNSHGGFGFGWWYRWGCSSFKFSSYSCFASCN